MISKSVLIVTLQSFSKNRNVLASQSKRVGLKDLTCLPLCFAVKRLATTLAQAVTTWLAVNPDSFLMSW